MTMQVADVFIDAFGRIHEEVGQVLDGVDGAVLGARVDPDANSIAWLVWHLARVQDAQVAPLFNV
ncbi:MAG: DinB family protein, partial [Micrococcales bacterium]|nr:DinB family protein [Micrococcales bacterium]